MSDQPAAKVRLHNFRGDETARTNFAKLLTMRGLGGDEEVARLAEGQSVTLTIPWPDLDVFKTAIENYEVEVEELRGTVE